MLGVWTVAAAWILASAPVRELLDTQGFYLPRGLELFAEHRPDVVIMDLAMPDMDGFQAAKAIREGPTGSSPVIVACSAFSLTEPAAGSDPAAPPRTTDRLRTTARGWLRARAWST